MLIDKILDAQLNNLKLNQNWQESGSSALSGTEPVLWHIILSNLFTRRERGVFTYWTGLSGRSVGFQLW